MRPKSQVVHQDHQIQQQDHRDLGRHLYLGKPKAMAVRSTHFLFPKEAASYVPGVDTRIPVDGGVQQFVGVDESRVYVVCFGNEVAHLPRSLFCLFDMDSWLSFVGCFGS